MSRRRLPPLQALPAFEATARLLSMTRAAREMHVTHGAVSRQIKALEENLGVSLFRRLTRRIALTDEGSDLFAVVARQFSELSAEAERLRGRKSATTRLAISTSVSFASKWLAPRLHRLKAMHPEYDIHLDVADVNVDLNESGMDVALRYGVGRYRGVLAERVLRETVTPVCSPGYLERIGAPLSAAALARCVLLREERMLANWEQWFAAAGAPGMRVDRGPAYSHGSLAIEAAIRGEGVALGRSALVAEDLAAGRLVAPFPDVRIEAERGYDLVYRVGEREHPKVCAVRDWLAEEIRRFETAAGEQARQT